MSYCAADNLQRNAKWDDRIGAISHLPLYFTISNGGHRFLFCSHWWTATPESTVIVKSHNRECQIRYLYVILSDIVRGQKEQQNTHRTDWLIKRTYSNAWWCCCWWWWYVFSFCLAHFFSKLPAFSLWCPYFDSLIFFSLLLFSNTKQKRHFLLYTFTHVHKHRFENRNSFFSSLCAKWKPWSFVNGIFYWNMTARGQLWFWCADKSECARRGERASEWQWAPKSSR